MAMKLLLFLLLPRRTPWPGRGVQPTGGATLPAYRVRDGEEVAIEIYNVLLNRIAYFLSLIHI